MDIKAILGDKAIKPKEKTTMLSEAVLNGTFATDDLLQVAKAGKDPIKATCIEVMEYATQQKPELINDAWFDFATASLAEKAPRVKWEAAKIIGNTAHLFTNRLDIAVASLLGNTMHTGTVVRWSAAFALGEILKLNLSLNKDLLPAIEDIVEKEEKNSICKVYLAAIKKLK